MRAVTSILLAACLAVAHGAAPAADAEDPASSTFADRFAATEAEIAALPEADLKKFYLNCSRAAIRGQIGGGEIQLCSVGYERLLQRSFGGDFRAFLEWRREAVKRPEAAEAQRHLTASASIPMGVRLDMFADEMNPRVCEAGETIFQTYDMGAEMYVVLEGQVELTIDSQTLEMLGPGEPFGEMALIDQAPRTATAIAKTACKLAVIPEKRFLFMVQTTPQFALQIMKVMADRLRKMNARF